MNPQDIAHIVSGLVEYRGRWIPVEKKAALIQQWQKRIEQGYVLYNGEWITIEEKVARVQPQAAAPPPAQPQNITINTTVNRQVYTVTNTTDNRSVTQHHEEHKHVHMDEQAMAESIKRRILDSPAGQDAVNGESPDALSEIRRNVLENPAKPPLSDPGKKRPLPPPE